jgi:hypothetical protein
MPRRADNVDFSFIARQNERIIDGVGFLRDENRVLTGICMRLESAQPAMVVELRALQSLIGRLDERFRKLETDGMSPEQVDAIAKRLEPRVVTALGDLITHHKLLAAIDERFRIIQGQLKELRERFGGAA